MTWRKPVGRIQLSRCGHYRIAVHGNRHYAIVFAGYRRDPTALLDRLGRFDAGNTEANIEAARRACDAHSLARGGARR